MAVEFIDLAWHGRHVRVEHAWIDRGNRTAPLTVFLHEGLGSLALWKDFPQQLCAAAGCRGLVYSRPGYGRSTPRAEGEAWGVDFMHQQAHLLLPALLQALGVDTVAEPPWLLGHSDGGSIALLHAARFAARIAGAIVVAPHIFVEDKALAAISQARDHYLKNELTNSGLPDGLKQRLARYHDDPDSAFWGWNTIWLDPAFRHWTIERELSAIRCPLLAVQGLDDEYGTLAQIHGIAQRVPQTQLLELPGCGHSPQRDQPQQLLAACAAFIHRHARSSDTAGPDAAAATPPP